MNKDVRTLISEAFDELYKEMVSEAPTLKKAYIPDEEVNNIIQNSLKRGTPVPNDFDSTALKSRENFDKIIDVLMDEYKKTGNKNAKAAIQGSYYPAPKSKMQRSVGMQFLGNPDLEEAALSAFEQVVINNFDKIADIYQSGSRGLGAIFTNDMRNKVKNFIESGYRGAGAGGGRLDVSAGREEMGGKALSMDEPIGDDAGSTFGDKLSSTLSTDDSALEKGFERQNKAATQKNILGDVISWLDNTFEELGDEMGKRRMIAFKGLVAGDTPDEIFENNPGIFASPARITEEFNRLISSKEAQEISKMISDIYNIDFNLANIDPKKLKQTSSMKPEFGGFSKIVKISTPEMKSAQADLNAALEAVGLKSTDFNSDRKKEEVIANLRSRGMDVELERIIDADDDLSAASEIAKAKGEYDVKTPLLPTTPEEELESGEKMYEGVDMDKLMERVYKKLTGK